MRYYADFDVFDHKSTPLQTQVLVFSSDGKKPLRNPRTGSLIGDAKPFTPSYRSSYKSTVFFIPYDEIYFAGGPTKFSARFEVLSEGKAVIISEPLTMQVESPPTR